MGVGRAMGSQSVMATEFSFAGSRVVQVDDNDGCTTI